ncbi:MAG: shikimate kinase [Oscillospiraceae bacterium]|nr:shikimate kinase [Oscillospiraceae bacterium]
MRKDNVVIIGMPASGKTTVGNALAKRLNCAFIDTDAVIKEKTVSTLQKLIADNGIDGFLDIESGIISAIEPARRTVISTGGSAIYRAAAIDYLRSIGRIVYLRAAEEELSERLHHPEERGVVIGENMSFHDLYIERAPLYERYADVIIDEEGKHYGQIVDELVRLFKR